MSNPSRAKLPDSGPVELAGQSSMDLRDDELEAIASGEDIQRTLTIIQGIYDTQMQTRLEQVNEDRFVLLREPASNGDLLFAINSENTVEAIQVDSFTLNRRIPPTVSNGILLVHDTQRDAAEEMLTERTSETSHAALRRCLQLLISQDINTRAVLLLGEKTDLCLVGTQTLREKIEKEGEGAIGLISKVFNALNARPDITLDYLLETFLPSLGISVLIFTH